MKTFFRPFLILVFALGCANSELAELPTNSNPQSLSAYLESIPNTFKIQVIDKTLIAPTRIKITPDGNFMFVAELQGTVQVYKKFDGNWIKQVTTFFDLGDLGISPGSQKGLTGLFFGANFFLDAPDPINREIFLNYIFFNGLEFRNRITRLTVSPVGMDLMGSDAQLIYEAPEPSVSNHQIQDGIGVTYERAPHILVAIGDAAKPEDALDETKEGIGKIILIQRDGSDPLGPRPFTNPKIQAIGVRNPYGIVMLPPAIDPLQRILGVEPGNKNNDRIWFLELIDFGHEQDAPMSLGYNGSDMDSSWTNITDANNPGPADIEGVLTLINPTTTPTSASLHPGKGIIPPPAGGNVSFITANFGNTSEGGDRGRSIALGVIEGLENQPRIKMLNNIIEHNPAMIDEQGSPLALNVDPTTGDILFADIYTGELLKAAPIIP